MRTWTILLVGLLILLVYLATIAPGPFWRDSAEFVMIPFNLDIGHPAGSPTFTMLAGLAARLPIGNIAFRSNMVSTLCGTIAFFAFVFAGMTVVRKIYPDLSAGLGAMISVCVMTPLVFSSGLWYWTVTAEVYTGMMAILAFLMALSVGLHKDHAPVDHRIIYTIGFLLGLSCGLHMVMILYSPAFFLYIFLTRKSDLSPFRIIGFGFSFLMGFSVFALLPIRSAVNPPFDSGNPETRDAFFAHITGRKYSDILQSYPWHRIMENLQYLVGNIVSQVTVIHAVSAIGGILVLVIKSWRTALFFFLITAGHLYLYVRDWKKDFGYLTIYLVAALLSVVLISSVVAWLLKVRPKSKIGIGVVLVALTIAGAGFLLMNNYHYCNRNGHDLVLRQTRSLLDSLPPDSMLVSHEDYINYTSVYMQSIERWREDIIHFHRVYLTVPQYLLKKFPYLNVTSLDNMPYSYHRFFMDNAAVHPPFWDYGKEPKSELYLEKLVLYGRFWRVIEEPLEEEQFYLAEKNSHALWQKTMGKITSDPLFNENDWTALEVTARFYTKQADYYFKMGRHESARKLWWRALALRPDLASVYANLASLDLIEGRQDDALANAEKSVEIDDLDSMLWNNYGIIALQLGKKDLMTKAFVKSLKINKTQYQICYYLANSFQGSGDFIKSGKYANNGLVYAKDPKMIYKLNVLLANSLFMQERYEQAMQTLVKLAGENPVDEQIKLLIAKCKEKMVNP